MPDGATDLDVALQKNERLRRFLEAQVRDGSIRGHGSIAGILPAWGRRLLGGGEETPPRSSGPLARNLRCSSDSPRFRQGAEGLVENLSNSS